MLKRPIPTTGEMLPIVGCGTWQTFDVGPSPSQRLPLHNVLRTLFNGGGTVIDSSPMYGRAEGVVGDLVAELDARDRAFIATKVWTRGRDAGIAQMTQSLRFLKASPLDLVGIVKLAAGRVA